MERKPLHYFVVQGHTLFIPLRDLYAECMVLIDDQPQAFPLQCFQRNCLKMKGCPEILAKRVNYLFTQVCPGAEMILAYFKYRDRPNSIRAGVFTKDLDTPKVTVINPWGFRKYQKEGIAFQWYPTDDYLFMGTSRELISAASLLR